MSAGTNALLMAIVALGAVVAVQAYMATRLHLAAGLVVPAGFLGLAGYNLYKSLFVYNPYPTMAEGMMMTLGLAGFAVSGVVLVICRLAGRRRAAGRAT